MPENYEEISDAALALAPGARAILAGNLLQSVSSYLDAAQQTVGRVNGVSVSRWPKDQTEAFDLTLMLPPDLEFGLKREAGARRVSIEQFALEALREHVERSLQTRVGQLQELFRRWQEEEVDESEALDDEFFKMLDDDRPSDRKLFPPELKGISW